MTNMAGQKDGRFPVFELAYSDSLTGGPKYARSRQGVLFLRLAKGGAFSWINLRIVSSQVPLKMKYKCLYRQPGTEIDPYGGGFRWPTMSARRLALHQKTRNRI